MRTALLAMLLAAIVAGFGCRSPEAPSDAVENPQDRKLFKDVTPSEAYAATAAGGVEFIDVRSEAEFKGRHAPNSTNVPMVILNGRMSEMDRSKPVYVICEVGRRSEDAARQLTDAGFKDVRHVTGGVVAWIKAGFPLVPEAKEKKNE